MKKLLKNIFIFAMINLSIVCNVKAENTIITSPIDSRPISIEYLENLTDLGGDKFITPNKNNLDFFSDSNTKNNKFANSENVRKELSNNVSKYNNDNTTVIINTSSYLTGGLIGSRSSTNYVDYKEGLNELNELTSKYSNPYYYVNSIMPRTLPEERNNSIWPNNDKVDGLGKYFAKYNNCDASIINQFSKVQPSQLLMEWSYVQNKKNEGFKLEKWEIEFLNYFEKSYLNNKKYNQYISNYVSIFENSSDIIKRLIDMTINGQIDELTISIDDFQLPTFIRHLTKTNKVNTSWIPKENGNAIKFSWARTYLNTGSNSVNNYHISKLGKKEFNLALDAKSDKINYIYGVDEIPQMIYARDLTKRKNLCTNIHLIYDYNLDIAASKNDVGIYDSKTVNETATNVLNFVNPKSNNVVEQEFKIYINKYLETKSNINDENMDKMIIDMFNSYNNGCNIGLFEFYSVDIINNGSNELFKRLSNKDYLNKLGINDNSIAQLGTYSSWNTVGNTLGLGLAHAQVFSIAESINENKKEVAINNSIVLSQHLLEDGSYAGQLKHLFSNKYNLTLDSSKYLEKTLFNELNESNILNSFIDCEIDINGENVTINNASLEQAGLPWLRKFDCFISTNFS